VDGSAISSTEVVVHPLSASRNEPARIHAEVGARVNQELPFTVAVSNEEAAHRCGADVSLVMSAALVSMLVVGAGWCTLLCSGTELAVVPAEGGGCVASVWGSAGLGPGWGSGAGAGISGTGVGVSVAEGRVLEAGTEVGPLGTE
jgi:hypothetical protein